MLPTMASIWSNITWMLPINLRSDSSCFHLGAILVSVSPLVLELLLCWVKTKRQLLFVTKFWVGPSGEHPLLLKDEGTGT